MCLTLLLFADDMVLFSTDPAELQLLLNKLYKYLPEWGLKVNTSKTKICIFEKRKSNIDFTWSYDGQNLEIVDSFTYLGMKFTANGSLEAGAKALSDQALRAVNNLLGLFQRVHFDIKTKLALFDSLVTPILLYGAEVWGLYDYSCIDKIHIKFCKIILGVRQQTPNYSVYGELGRVPLSVIAKERATKFWLKILSNPFSLLNKTFNDQVNEIENRLITNRNTAKRHWASVMKSLIENLGFPDMWRDQFQHTPSFQILKTHIRGQFLQHWCAQINNFSKLHYYAKFKSEFKFEKYLQVIENDKLRKTLTSFRVSAHNLEIERRRYQNIPREHRFCKLCNLKQVELEYHFLLVCPFHAVLRQTYMYLGRSPWPSISKFVNIMDCSSRTFIQKLSKYVYFATSRRSEAIDGISDS